MKCCNHLLAVDRLMYQIVMHVFGRMMKVVAMA